MTTTFLDIVNIGPDCIERFIDRVNAPEIRHLDIELAGCSNLSGEYRVGRVFPANHTLFYTLSGAGVVRTPDGDFTLSQNSLAVLKANAPFEVEIAAPRWDIIWLNLSDTPRWYAVHDAETPVVEHCDLQVVHHAMEILYQEQQATMRAAVMPLIEKHLSNTVLSSNAHRQPNRLSQLFATIDNQLQLPWTVKAMCDRVHYSAPHLHRLCLAQFGRSPVQQLIHLRMERAKKLLLNTNWPISHIGQYVGYPNVFNFSKRFSKSVGRSPSAFRKQL
ncbi:AraC family transcriptional regulator [Aestuariibacter sp. A3R04]|uniref:helix-turn-helix transcriptional regulator n=1 Tax=Aestuariibacter sp. A3R04 TaxID=2841571 RepID=UPI001C09DDFC|nr:AraC family transcriptional regulator [Aestuariibacter sp. A3R04]MBU3020615.1 AraC family transcriptional regulator [Aestuariibacter sp. A3R04]